MLLSDFMNDGVPGDDGYGGMHPVLYDAILNYKITGDYPDFLDVRETRNAYNSFKKKCDHFELFHSNKLIYVGQRREVARVVVRRGEVKTAIKLLHTMHGHAGQKFTTSAVSRRLYWRGIRRDVTKFISECVVCERIRKENASLQVVPVFIDSDGYRAESESISSSVFLSNEEVALSERLCLDIREFITTQGEGEEEQGERSGQGGAHAHGSQEVEESQDEICATDEAVEYVLEDGTGYMLEDMVIHEEEISDSMDVIDGEGRMMYTRSYEVPSVSNVIKVEVSDYRDAEHDRRGDSMSNGHCSAPGVNNIVSVTHSVPVAPSICPVKEVSSSNGITASSSVNNASRTARILPQPITLQDVLLQPSTSSFSGDDSLPPAEPSFLCTKVDRKPLTRNQVCQRVEQPDESSQSRRNATKRRINDEVSASNDDGIRKARHSAAVARSDDGGSYTEGEGYDLKWSDERLEDTVDPSKHPLVIQKQMKVLELQEEVLMLQKTYWLKQLEDQRRGRGQTSDRSYRSSPNYN